MHGKHLFSYAKFFPQLVSRPVPLCVCVGIFCVGFLIFRLIALLQSTELEFGTLIESQQCMQTVSSHHVANSHQTECVGGKYCIY